MSDASVGSIIGYLKLDRSDWDTELTAAGAKADELGRKSPNVKISTNAPSAIAQLALVSAAVKRLQDAQGAEGVAQAKLTDLQNKGGASTGQLAAAEERLQKAHRATAAAAIGLANAHDQNDAAMRRASADADKLASSTTKTGTAADKSTSQMHLLRDAILLIGPAAIPIAAVAAGAILGLAPVAAAAVLGVKGISDEFKSGALAGTQYGSDIQSLVGEFTNLKQTAANNLLGGVDQAIQSSQPLFGALNTDIGTLSAQLGQIVAGAAPALLTILNALNPLFVTFGQLLSDGATKLEHWATSSDGITKFVSYVQAELPTVITALGQLIETAGRLLAALAPMGHVILTGIGTLAAVLNAIPTPVLTVLASGAIAAYAAFRTYSGIQALLKPVNAALVAHAATVSTTAATVQAASASSQLAVADEAAAVATAKAEEAAAVARANAAIIESQDGTASLFQAEAVSAVGAAEEITASWAGVASLFATESTLIAEASAQEALAFQTTAASAIAAADEIAAASVAAADTVAVEGKVAGLGFTAMLGPIAAVVVGVGLLASTFLMGTSSAQAAAAAADSYAQSVQKSTNALSLENIQQTNANLSKDGALKLLDQMQQKNQALWISQIDLTTAVNGTKEQFDALEKSILASAGSDVLKQASASALNIKLATLRKGLQDQILSQTQLNSINAASLGVSDAQVTAAAKLYDLTGTKGVAAYLAAQQAALQNTQQAQAQTLQFQLENDAASLLAQTLDKLAGKNLGYAQAQNSFDSALTNMGDHISATGKKITFTTDSINNMSSASVALRGQLLGQVTAAESTAEAYGKMKGSSEAGREELVKLRSEIISNAVAHGVDRAAVTAYIDSVLKIPKTVPPTKLQIDKAQAEAELAKMKADLASLTNQRYIINIQEVLSGGTANIGGSGVNVKAQAAGTGPGGLPDGWSTVGEQGFELAHTANGKTQIYSNPDSKKMLGVSKVPGFAAGTATYTANSGITYSSQTAANNANLAATVAAIKALETTQREYQYTYLPNFLKALSGTTTGLENAGRSLIAEVAKTAQAHQLSASMVTFISDENAKMDKLAVERDSIAAKFKAANDKLAADLQAKAAEASSIASSLNNFNLASDTPATAGATPADAGASQRAAAAAAQQAAAAATAAGKSSADVAAAAAAAAQAVIGAMSSGSSGDGGIGGVIGDLESATEKAALFGQEMQQLAAMGLNKTDLQQLADAGDTDAVMQRIQDLLAATPGQIAQINDLTKQLTVTASTVGNKLAGDLYDAGIAADKGIVAGLKAGEGEITKQITALADAIVATLKAKLQIHSPSKVMHSIGVFTGQGFADGLTASQGRTLLAARSLANASIPKFGSMPTRSGYQPLAGGSSTSDVAVLRAEFAELRSEIRASSRENAQMVTSGIGGSFDRSMTAAARTARDEARRK